MKLFLCVMSTSIHLSSALWSQPIFTEDLLCPTILDSEVKAMNETKSPGVFKSTGPVHCFLHMTQDFSLLPRFFGVLFMFSFQFVRSLRAKCSFSLEFSGGPVVRTLRFHCKGRRFHSLGESIGESEEIGRAHV